MKSTNMMIVIAMKVYTYKEQDKDFCMDCKVEMEEFTIQPDGCWQCTMCESCVEDNCGCSNQVDGTMDALSCEKCERYVCTSDDCDNTYYENKDSEVFCPKCWIEYLNKQIYYTMQNIKKRNWLYELNDLNFNGLSFYRLREQIRTEIVNLDLDRQDLTLAVKVALMSVKDEIINQIVTFLKKGD